MTLNWPYFVASQTSGVDGASEGGRLSTSRLPSTLVLYTVPLVKEIRRSGYQSKLTAEPVLMDGTWVFRVTYEGDKPDGVPERWHGRQVILEEAKPSDG
jgi:hypothetical protein